MNRRAGFEYRCVLVVEMAACVDAYGVFAHCAAKFGLAERVWYWQVVVRASRVL